MTYKMNIRDRKPLLKRIRDLTGEQGHYTFMPRVAYEFEGFSLEKDGSIVTSSDVGKRVIDKLLAEGMIRDAADEPETSTETEQPGEETEHTSETENPSEEAEDAAEDEQIGEKAGTAETHAEEADVQIAEGEPEEMSPEDIEDESGPIKPSVGVPLNGHSGRSLRNLIFLLYSRGHLISKSTGGEFGASDELVNELKTVPEYPKADTLIERIRKFEAEHGPSLKGLGITEDKVVFTGFPVTDDPDEIQAFVHLASLMNRQAIEQNRIQSKPVDESNERYSMRTWLLRIGMNGDAFKETRSILMKKLDGHTAFRTPADAARWRERRKAIREEQNAALEESAAQEENEADAIPELDATAEAGAEERVVS